MLERRIHLQTELTPRALACACAEGLLGELIKNARLGFSDMSTELPFHQTVQLIASARGFHHHHEYPVVLTKGKGDHRRLDFVFAKVDSQTRNKSKYPRISSAIAVEMKVVGRRSKNNESSRVNSDKPSSKKFKSVTKDVAKIKHFLNTAADDHNIGYAAGYLIVVNLDIDSGICWDVKSTGGAVDKDVRLLQRYTYSRGLIHKSVTIYEVIQ